MKTANEIKTSVTKRLRYCWGENLAIFFLTIGGLAAAILAWMMVADFITIYSDGRIFQSHVDLSNGMILAVTAVSLLLLWSAAAPFQYGIKWYRLQQIRGNSVHARSFFSCYGSQKRIIQVYKLSLTLYLKRMYFMLPITAALCLGIYLANKIGETNGGVLYSAAAVLVFLLAGCLICAAAVFNFKYSLAPYLFVLDTNAPPKELIKRSTELTQGKQGYMADIMLTAMRWLPPCLLVFPALFVVPYLKMMYIAAINEIILDGESPDSHGKQGELFEEEYTHY